MSIEMYSHNQLSGESTPYDTIVNDDGDVVVPDRYDELGEEYNFESPRVPEVVIGPSVRLDERYIALAGMSKRYKEYAAAKGFKAASVDPKKRPKLRKEYADLDLMANDKLAKARYTLQDERNALMPLLKTGELLAAGFAEYEVEEAEQETVHAIRNNFGSSVGYKKRNKNMSKVHQPTNLE